MRTGRGQALLELALCAPVVLLLAIGTVASVQVASAHAGLEAATQAAAEAAARAPSAQAAVAAGNQRFRDVVAGYPVRSATLALSLGDFARTGSVTASSSASVDLTWAAFTLLPGRLALHSEVRVRIETWRSRTT
ncbi:MAG TPA: TadE/TadG family type IV pilus assembly protein [Candidatus Dormibacteraeota bacterium]|nr:TadE/TadG family type IV pilus assembly protein [Candidatus Dormibacteraeota bacterium]